MKTNPVVEHLIQAAAALALAALCASASAQPYPNKPIKVIVPWPPGASVDVVSRLVSNAISAKVGQPFVVENKPGATGAIGADSVAASPADGYTLLSVANVYIMAKALQGKPFDFKNEWTSVAGIASAATMFTINPKVVPGVKDFKDFLAYVKANPGTVLNYGSSGTGSSTHLAMVLITMRYGLNATHVPYKGQVLAVTDFIAGRLSAMVMDYGAGKAHIAAGTLLPLMLALPKRLQDQPDLPTARELGFHYLESTMISFGFVAPKGTPPAIAARLADATREVVADRDIQDGIRKAGNEPNFIDTAAYAASLDDTYTRFIKIIKENSIKTD